MAWTLFAAYNAGFDFRVLKQTHADLGGEGAILQNAVKVLDIWQFACETKLSQKQYAALLALKAGCHRLATSRRAQNLPIATARAITHLLRITPRYRMRELRSPFSRNALSKKARSVWHRQCPAMAHRQRERGEDADVHGSKVA
jgi:DNA polymerase III epsilon subunit-like protein